MGMVLEHGVGVAVLLALLLLHGWTGVWVSRCIVRRAEGGTTPRNGNPAQASKKPATDPHLRLLELVLEHVPCRNSLVPSTSSDADLSAQSA